MKEKEEAERGCVYVECSRRRAERRGYDAWGRQGHRAAVTLGVLGRCQRQAVSAPGKWTAARPAWRDWLPTSPPAHTALPAVRLDIVPAPKSRSSTAAPPCVWS